MTTMTLLQEVMMEAAVIGQADDHRGWYICEPQGIWYLFDDGEIRKTCSSEPDCSAFWPSREAATTFYQQWKESTQEE
ncbi:hypothetical protein [Dongshaea marina]|uniref:hypothetical protein n=1 Tax=Dongshaea marina TaxID=2047966 RepID=UPI000D3E17C6|nr:hypothetical protein [Dongshaea marina]